MKKLLYTSITLNILGLAIVILGIVKLGGISNIVYKLKAKHVIAKMTHRNDQFSNSPVNSGAIIFLGDSITEYGEWSELFPNYNILNRGIAGDGIQGVQDRLHEIIRHQPAKIFIMIGVNDLCFHSSEYVINRYKALLGELSQKLLNTEIVVQSILPVNNEIYETGTNNKEIDKVNAFLSEYCNEKGLVYLDIASQLKDQENRLNRIFSSDGIHINGIAYNVWKENLKTWLPKK